MKLKQKEMKTRVPIQNILLDLGATACLSTPNNPNAWSRCCSLCRLLASTQHVMEHWSSSPIIIFYFSLTIIKLQSGASMSFSFLGSWPRLQRWWYIESSILCSRFLSVNVQQISSGVRLEQWNLWNKTFLTCFLRQVDSSKVRNIYQCLHNVDCFFRKCNYWFSPPVTCWQCPM